MYNRDLVHEVGRLTQVQVHRLPEPALLDVQAVEVLVVAEPRHRDPARDVQDTLGLEGFGTRASAGAADPTHGSVATSVAAQDPSPLRLPLHHPRFRGRAVKERVDAVGGRAAVPDEVVVLEQPCVLVSHWILTTGPESRNCGIVFECETSNRQMCFNTP